MALSGGRVQINRAVRIVRRVLSSVGTPTLGRATPSQDLTQAAQAQRRAKRGFSVNADTDTTPDTGAPTEFYDLATGTVRFWPCDASAPNVSEVVRELLGDASLGLSERGDE